jgi:hypothetical protein
MDDHSDPTQGNRAAVDPVPGRSAGWRLALQFAGSRRIVVNATKIAAVGGTLLNGINQGAALLDGQAISVTHLVLNYLVPYSVATYSAVRLRLQQTAAKESDPV